MPRGLQRAGCAVGPTVGFSVERCYRRGGPNGQAKTAGPFAKALRPKVRKGPSPSKKARRVAEVPRGVIDMPRRIARGPRRVTEAPRTQGSEAPKATLGQLKDVRGPSSKGHLASHVVVDQDHQPGESTVSRRLRIRVGKVVAAPMGRRPF